MSFLTVGGEQNLTPEPDNTLYTEPQISPARQRPNRAVCQDLNEDTRGGHAFGRVWRGPLSSAPPSCFGKKGLGITVKMILLVEGEEG